MKAMKKQHEGHEEKIKRKDLKDKKETAFGGGFFYSGSRVEPGMTKV